MPGLDGLELARVLRRFEEPPAIVFVSAYETGAVDAFELKALDYLMKPVSSKRLAEALGRVREARGAVSTRPDDVVPLPPCARAPGWSARLDPVPASRRRLRAGDLRRGALPHARAGVGAGPPLA